jgi:hypothetical protein
MSKESKNKKRSVKASKQKPVCEQPPVNRTLTPEEKARIIRDRLANRPVIMLRYRNGKLNLRFIITLALLIVGMIVALYFISRH